MSALRILQPPQVTQVISKNKYMFQYTVVGYIESVQLTSHLTLHMYIVDWLILNKNNFRSLSISFLIVRSRDFDRKKTSKSLFN